MTTFCANCEQDKHCSEFYDANSVMCLDCYDLDPSRDYDAISSSFTYLLNNKALRERQKMTKVRDDNTSKQIDKLQEETNIKIDKLTETFESAKYDLNLKYQAIYDELDEKEAKYDLLKQNVKKLQKLQKSREETEEKHADQLDKLTQSHNSKVEVLETKLEQQLAKIKKPTKQNDIPIIKHEFFHIQEFLEMFDSGTITHEDLTKKIFEMLELELDNSDLVISKIVLGELIQQNGLVSSRLRLLERKIRNGYDQGLESLRPQLNPFKAWSNAKLTYAADKRSSVAELYETFKRFLPNTKIALSEFGKQLKQFFIDESKEVSQTKSNGCIKWKGVGVNAEAELEAEPEAEPEPEPEAEPEAELEPEPELSEVEVENSASAEDDEQDDDDEYAALQLEIELLEKKKKLLALRKQRSSPQKN